MRSIDEIAYLNCGDWVENCSATVEHLHGRWEPQVNGAVNTFNNVIRRLEVQDVDVTVVHPLLFRMVNLPRYPEVRMASSPVKVYRALDELV